ncbi:HEAT repeat domain-containing protein [Methanoculleus sediminis]|uniref:HEAT repeat domain-containing protein n=1 Tax=Methanoculleus sediminis TaxID=1550566 RepID=UPI0009E48254|nr:HEAT repeat domain-containing protein [Methanoculleus sediminis]
MTQSIPPEPEDDRLNSRDLQVLISRLSDTDKGVRAEAMHGLAAIGKPAVPACIALLSDGDWRVRYRAAEALGLLGDPRAYAPLVAALDDEKDHVRYMAAKGLGLLGDPRAVERLGRMRNDENEFVRRSAARSLGAIGGEEAVLALREGLKGETTDAVRAAILEALRDAGNDGRERSERPELEHRRCEYGVGAPQVRVTTGGSVASGRSWSTAGASCDAP